MRWQGGERIGRLIGERHKEKRREEGEEIDV